MARRAGYTIMELAITISILGLLAVFAFVNVNEQMKSVKLSSAVNRLISDLQYWMIKANSCANWSGFSFEATPSNRYYLCSTLAGHAITTDGPIPGKPYIVDLESEYGVSILSVNVPYIEFNPNMIPYTDRYNDAILTSEVVVRLRYGSTNSRYVCIQPYTGFVYVR